MFRILNNLLILAITILLLTGCKQTKDHNYFLTHPKQLEAEYNYCTLLTEPEAYSDPECVAAINAAQLVSQAATNPIAYGKHILSAQMQLASSQQALADLNKETKQLSVSNNPNAQANIQNKQGQINQLNNTIAKLKRQITTYYAALSLIYSRPN